VLPQDYRLWYLRRGALCHSPRGKTLASVCRRVDASGITSQLCPAMDIVKQMDSRHSGKRRVLQSCNTPKLFIPPGHFIIDINNRNLLNCYLGIAILIEIVLAGPHFRS
jgi:hypothetical protein